MIEYLRTRHRDLLDLLENPTERERGFVFFFLNPRNYLFLRSRPWLLRHSYYGIDGLLARALVGRLVLGKPIRRQAFDFTSLAAPVLAHCADRGLRVFFAGGREAEVREFAGIVARMFPTLRVAGWCDGFREEEELAEVIIRAEPDIVVLGLGNLKQETAAAGLYLRRPGCYVTCGAFISQTARAGGKYYPEFVNQYELKWLYRALKEGRVRKRILIHYPMFVGQFFLDLVGWRLTRRNAERW
jgi:N-acetylglucosaminyldiphosphoundecaprenol N-acetyl-beta-D-mannosaminyltransferase